MTEVRFYHLQRKTLEDALPQILEKTLERGWRAVVMAGSEERVEALTQHLWSYKEFGFLPHGSARDGDATVPCILAGPTCDSVDVMYEKTPYMLPFSLEIGDKLLIEGTGAYTTTYSAVAFNGFPPLKQYVI